jgi:methylenetetrahydrofolate reductase (NADH)
VGPGALGDLLKRPRYEVFPLEGIEDEVAAHVPRDIPVTITSSPSRGMDTTLELAAALVARGFEVIPHLSARLVVDAGHLEGILGRLTEIGVSDVLVIGGDVQEPKGSFAGAFELLSAMAQLGHGLDAIGIAGYPESHPFISDEQTIEAMFAKAPLATYIVSQLCFEPAVIAGWIAAVRERGVDLPIRIGIPGAVSRARLLRISTKIGVGESSRFLRGHRSVLARLFLRGTYGPGSLIDGLTSYLGDASRNVGGFHIYTFNDLEKTELWRRETIRRLDRAASGTRSRSE